MWPLFSPRRSRIVLDGGPRKQIGSGHLRGARGPIRATTTPVPPPTDNDLRFFRGPAPTIPPSPPENYVGCHLTPFFRSGGGEVHFRLIKPEIGLDDGSSVFAGV